MSKKKIHTDNPVLLNALDIIISLIPFVLLILIGILKMNITFHMKVFKTMVIFAFDIFLLLTSFIYIYINKELLVKKRKYLLFFLFYFLYIFIQYIISFVSKEISYDRDYHLGNYILLILFGFFFFINLKKLVQIELGILIINLFMLIVIIWSLIELINVNFNFGSIRPELSFGNTDYFAGYLIGLLPLSLTGAVIWLMKSIKTNRPYMLIISVICFILSITGILPLIATQTKAAIFGWYIGYVIIFFGCAILLIKKLSIKSRVIISLGYLTSCLIIPVLLLLFPPPFIKLIFKRIFDAFNDFDFFLKDRIENGWAGALGLFKDHPLFGAGLGTVYPACFKYIGKFFYLYSGSNSFKHSHCEYVEILGEAGIFGITVFSALILFILISLFKIVFSDRYITRFRLLALGTNSGLISMLIHQIFSLSLRMSVTMTAFFFLAGLGVFIISYRNKAVIESCDEESRDDDESENNKNRIISYFNKNISLKNFNIILLIVLVLIIYSLILISPVFRSEYNIVMSDKCHNIANNIYDQALKDKKNINNYAEEFSMYIELANKYIKNSVKIKPDNPYAWTQKYLLDYYTNTRLANSNSDYETVLNDIKTDLDKLNSIIPGYQDVWSKYVEYYLNMEQFYVSTSNFKGVDESLKKALENIDKSLSSNYLNEFNHVNKLILLLRFREKEKFYAAMEDYLKAKIYLDIARRKKIIKERIKINISEASSLTLSNNIYSFNLSENDISILSDKYYNMDSTPEYRYMKYGINKDIEELFKKNYEQAYK